MLATSDEHERERRPGPLGAARDGQHVAVRGVAALGQGVHRPLAFPHRLTKEQHVLIVGGGDVGASRLYHVLCASPRRVTLVCPAAGLAPQTRALIALRPEVVTHVDRAFSAQDDIAAAEGLDMVLGCIPSDAESRQIALAARELKVPVNCADVPALCDFYFGAVVRDSTGAFTLLLSTGGGAPRLARRVRAALTRTVARLAGATDARTGRPSAGTTVLAGDSSSTGSQQPSDLARAIGNVSAMRATLRKSAEGGTSKAEVRRRMRWMSELCDSWSIAELAQLDQARRDRLAQGYARELEQQLDNGRLTKVADHDDGWTATVPPFSLRLVPRRCPVVPDADGSATRCPVVLFTGGLATGLGLATLAFTTWHRLSAGTGAR